MDYPEIWAMFYASLVSIQGHPRNENPRSFVQLAEDADAMYSQFCLRKEGKTWLPG